ncbi:putative Glucokinase [uncultured delta proteobacterium]|uniref:Putative Glucokinase n=1 Tax=uncultured delta proteobacterium TaxID=34034 RepID=A0A212KD70_9DELT|nr:putative Glucokinase [uncultured delta proteobacterium]
MTDAPSMKTILAADIGGTHSRFALFRLDPRSPDPLATLRLVRRVRFSTAASTDTGHMMRTLAASAGDDGGFFLPASSEPVHVDAAVLGIPGPAAVADASIAPPEGEVCYCPNIRWPLEARPVMDALEGAPVRFINDFVANGFACALLPHRIDAVTVLAGEDRPGFPRAVIGAGTGLGHCCILPGPVPVVAGAEAGHTLFPFTREEEDLYRYLAELHGTDRISGDMAVAGNGLSNLYAYCTGEKIPAHEVAPLAAANPEVMEVIARLYGRAVAHYVLNTLPLGGIFITGGLAANLPGVLGHPSFAAELREKNPMGRSLGAIPVMHVRNHDLGLWGSAAYAALLLREGRV